jgi:predicted DNA binding CopG/RHH family protein
MTIQLDAYEQDILDSVEHGEWQSVPNLKQEIERYQHHAKAYMQFIQKVTIEISNSDLNSLQRLASNSGVSMSLLLSSIIHQYVGFIEQNDMEESQQRT